MKKLLISLGILPVLFSPLCLAETPVFHLDFKGKNYNFHHYHIDLTAENFILKKDNQLISTTPVYRDRIRNFKVKHIRKTENGFIIEAIWGGGGYYYNPLFYFNFDKQKDSFYFYKLDECMVHNITDSEKPPSFSFNHYQSQLTPPLPIAKFNFIMAYNKPSIDKYTPNSNYCKRFNALRP